MSRIKPGSSFFAGRRQASIDLLQSVHRDSAVLLYGGRQSGKTSFLLAITREMRALRAKISELTALDVPVYVDLTTLHYDATPADFFGLLIRKTRESLELQIEGFSAEAHCR